MDGHVLAARVRAAAEDQRASGPIELRDRHHDSGLDRQQAALRAVPLLERLKFDRMSRDVGHIQPRERLLGSLRVVVCGTPHQREPGERDEGIDLDSALFHEEFLDGRTRVEPGGKGGNHAQPPRLNASITPS